MKIINISLRENSYPVYIGIDILRNFRYLLAKHFKTRQIAVITSKNIDNLYGHILRKSIQKDIKTVTLYVPDGEKAKSLEQVQKIYTRLLRKKFERGSLIVALGGGVIGDLAGFVAATYLRGVALVQVPTTLLAQVDSSIGGKVGVNHPLGKNLIGAFKQPLFVLSDVKVLQTLTDEEVRCGMGEVVKYGFILNPEFFEYLELNLEKALNKDVNVLNHLVEVSSMEKAGVVMKDEKEQNLRMILNFGHTFGHALETDLKFGKLKHGEAVILGMKCALQYLKLKNRIAENDYFRGMQLLNRIPVVYDIKKINPEKLMDRMLLDKKVKDGKIRLVLIERIGSHKIESESDQRIMAESYAILK